MFIMWAEYKAQCYMYLLKLWMQIPKAPFSVASVILFSYRQKVITLSLMQIKIRLI